ncbi:hypothetical protein SERLA73DRAFT_175713 [Serpula lacrymans var. lacrymans S7.3]|uniref:Lipid droplet-associated perilipin protein n=2 Tax=Serpula lacrymans var. lacrymans TaxID=341189 RepID=F8PL88_SERL3|nr:uncharacterized protein SERLADRAFT_458281 [Serpula lacrymans var. lacrymans S7.9]EGO03996.1 hypothetical protein SERLA73DRAFT_175713 [Serpula lacrymans var. lacrymans S7.3]EGO29915.1 hypothetical protein SERLADRAFT_458281 [Serpula lacrymans var. lacrymans S7.9]
MAPEVTIFTRVLSIPLVSSSLSTLDSTLCGNVFTRSPYTTAQALTHSAYSYTEPIQIRLAPFIIRADGYANKGLDAVESRYPYPFKAKPEEMVNYVKERRESAMSAANKTIDERVKSPAYGVAQGIDQRFAPIIDYFQVAVNKIGNESGASSPGSDSQYQYQRAYALSKHLKDNLYVFSQEHLKQLQSQSVLVQRATDTAQNITNLASSSLTNAQTRIHGLSGSMVQELQKLQSSTAQLPQQLQSNFPDLSATITDLRNIVTAPNVPMNEKVNKVTTEVKERVRPMLDNVSRRVSELVNVLGQKKDEAKNEVNQQTNGHAPLT